MSVRSLLVALLAGILVACGAPADPGATPDDRGDVPEDEAPDDMPDDVDDPFADFDRETERAEAESLLGLPEDAVEETPERRIVRRGDEHFAVTMDLRPGRHNVELDDDGSGAYVVTRVVVEVPDDEDPLIVE